MFFLCGLFFGSFLNAWILRVHEGSSILKGRSRCSSCDKALLWRDLIPIVSFFLLRGRCRWCHTLISRQYPLVEAWMGIAFFVIRQWYENDWMAAGSMLFVLFFLTFVFVSDLRFMEIPLQATIAPAGIFFLFSAVREPKMIMPMVIGSCSIAGFFLLQYLVSRGQWIGLGDVWFGVFMGVVLGSVNLMAVFFGLVMSYLLGALAALSMLFFFDKNWKTKVPFGIFLVVGTFLATKGLSVL